MSVLRNGIDELAVRMAASPGAWVASAVYGNWIQLKGKARSILFAPEVNALDANLLVEVFEATDSAGAGAQELTGVTTGKNFVNGTDEARVGLILVHEGDLSDGFSHVALRVTPGSTQEFAATAILLGLYSYPASNLPADGVAWAVGNTAHS